MIRGDISDARLMSHNFANAVLEAIEPTDGDTVSQKSFVPHFSGQKWDKTFLDKYTTEEGLRTSLQWRGHEPTQDRWVVTDPNAPDKFIAYAWVFAQSQERVVTLVRVHPTWRRQGRVILVSATHSLAVRNLPKTDIHHSFNLQNAVTILLPAPPPSCAQYRRQR